jgi:hypothetical protein
LIAIQNQWDLTRMRKDRFTICNDAAELQVPQEEIWGRERRKVLLLSYYYTCCPTNPKMLPHPPLQTQLYLTSKEETNLGTL